MSYDPVPGMRVVCILDNVTDWERQIPSVTFPQRGAVYTIREVPIPDYLRLVEITNAPAPPPFIAVEPYFFYLAFKPLDERRLDVFREALKKAPAPRERVEA